MLEECIQGLKIKKNGIYVDGTLGGAGHSIEIAKRLNDTGKLIGIDKDEEAIQAAKDIRRSKYRRCGWYFIRSRCFFIPTRPT